MTKSPNDQLRNDDLRVFTWLCTRNDFSPRVTDDDAKEEKEPWYFQYPPMTSVARSWRDSWKRTQRRMGEIPRESRLRSRHSLAVGRITRAGVNLVVGCVRAATDVLVPNANLIRAT